MSSFHYPPPDEHPQPTNPFLVSAASGVFTALFCGGSVIGAMGAAPIFVLGTALVGGIVGAVVGLLFGGREWLAVKMSGGRRPSDSLLLKLRVLSWVILFGTPVLGGLLFLAVAIVVNANEEARLRKLHAEVGQGNTVTSTPPAPSPDNRQPTPSTTMPQLPVTSESPTFPNSLTRSDFPSMPTPVPSLPPPAERFEPVVPERPVSPELPTPNGNERESGFAAEPTPQPTIQPMSPLEVSPDTSPKEAYEKIAAHFGETSVVRVIVNIPAGGTESSEEVRQALSKLVPQTDESYLYVTIQGPVAAAILAPIQDLDEIAGQLSARAKVQAERRIVSVDLSDLSAMVRNQDALEGKEAKEVQRLAQIVEQGNLRDKIEAYRQLGMLKSPAAVDYVVSRLALPSESIHAHDAIVAMGSIAQRPVLELLKSQDIVASSSAQMVLGDIATKEILPELEELAKSSDFHISSRAKHVIFRIQSR